MDNEQARFILRAYRPGGGDASDPQFAEALVQARRDPELGQWFASECALDQAIANKLKCSPVPSDLKGSILAGSRVMRPDFRRQRTVLLAVAAAVALVVTLVVLHQPPMTVPAFAEYRTDMLSFLDRLDRLDFASRDPAQLRPWLADHGGRSDFVIPTSLAGTDTLGCRVIDWHGRKATLICFRSDAGQIDGKVHLLVVDRSELQPIPPAGVPHVEQLGQWAVASWSDHRHAYLLASLGSADALTTLF